MVSLPVPMRSNHFRFGQPFWNLKDRHLEKVDLLFLSEDTDKHVKKFFSRLIKEMFCLKQVLTFQAVIFIIT